MKKPSKKPEKIRGLDPGKALQLIYADIFKTNETVDRLESEVKAMRTLLEKLLKIYTQTSKLEDELFKDIKSNDLRKP